MSDTVLERILAIVVETQVGMRELRSDLTGQIEAVRSDLTGQIGDVRLDLGSQIASLSARMDAFQSEFGAFRTEFGLMQGEVDDLQSELGKVRFELSEFRIETLDGFAAQQAELIQTRAEIMDRIDRLQDRMTMQREEDDMKIDIAERAERLLKSTRVEMESITEQLSKMTHMLRQLNIRVEHLEDRPNAA